MDSRGGTEREACNMANEFVRRGYDVTILCNDRNKGKPAWPLSEKVTLRNLNGTGKRLREEPCFWKICREAARSFRISLLYRFFSDLFQNERAQRLAPRVQAILSEEKPDVLISFFLNDQRLLNASEASKTIPSIQMVHNEPTVALCRDSLAYRGILNRCRAVQVLLPEFTMTMKRLCDRETAVIPNAVAAEEGGLVDHSASKRHYRVVNIARLDQTQKRPHLLIDAFARCHSTFPDWTLHLYGPTVRQNYRRRLERRIRQLGLNGSVFLEGSTDRVSDVLKGADIFAFPSAYEGFGLALVEAMTVGLPAVGYRSAPGVRSVIDDGVTGFLAEDGVDDFADRLAALMGSASLRRKMGQKAAAAAQRYSPKAVWDRWEELIRRTVQETGRRDS